MSKSTDTTARASLLQSRHDVIIVGGGAAGLATAIFAKRNSPALSVAILDGAHKLGAKILVSGGGRCNVTNVEVTPRDFNGGSRNTIKRVLNELPVADTIAFFSEIGVELHEEPNGKLFPNSNSAKTVLAALINEAERTGVAILTDTRVTALQRCNDAFELQCTNAIHRAENVVLATGGLSLPKTGSDGGGYALARAMGHSLNPTTPALAPLLLSGDFHKSLSGISQDVELTLRVEGQKPLHMSGAMLWTHFGISGPVVLDISRHWHNAKLENRAASLSVNFIPGETFDAVEQQFIQSANSSPKTSLRSILSERLPARVADQLFAHLHLNPATPMAHFAREDRRRLINALLAWPLQVQDSRGYAFAEVTAGGIPLDEIDPSSMQSRKCPGLYLVGEILDVDGRIGGFNFQWAWSTGFVAGRTVAQPPPAES